MKTTEAINLFGGVAKLAKALGISVQAVYQWGDVIPPLRVYEIREIAANQQDEDGQCADQVNANTLPSLAPEVVSQNSADQIDAEITGEAAK